MTNENLLRAYLSRVQKNSFYSAYHKTFKVVRADTDLMREKAYHLRHKVFVEENGWVNKAGLDRIETDAYDERAVHYLLIHRLTNEVAGTVRFVLPHEDNPKTSLPLQECCDHPLLGIDDKVMQLGEISRLCMAPFFRRREKDGSILPAYYDPELKGEETKGGKLTYFRRRIPYAPLGLVGAVFEAAIDAGVMDCVYAASPEEFDTFKRIGVDFRVLGPRLRGPSELQPVIFNVKHALDHMASVNPECWEIVSDQGRVHERANERLKNDWYERIFDDECKEAIMQKLM